MPRTTDCCRLATTGPPLLVTCTTSDVDARREAGEREHPLALGADDDAARARRVDRALLAEELEGDRRSTAAPGLAMVSSVVRPTAVEPPTSQVSLLGTAQSAAAKPR